MAKYKQALISSPKFASAKKKERKLTQLNGRTFLNKP